MQENRLNDRQRKIADLITANGEVRIHDLRSLFDVTEMTLRRDLEKLEEAGILKRTFGGAIALGRDVTLGERSVFMAEEKVRIGRAAATLVDKGESIFIDGGSTTLQIAKHLTPELNLTVVTNGINIAAELMERGVRTIVVGGMLLEVTASTVGPMAAEAIGKLAFNRAFLGASGISAKHGLSNSNPYEADLKRLVATRSSEIYAVLDHSKFGVTELFSFAELAAVRGLVTDRAPEGELAEACMEANVSVISG